MRFLKFPVILTVVYFVISYTNFSDHESIFFTAWLLIAAIGVSFTYGLLCMINLAHKRKELLTHGK